MKDSHFSTVKEGTELEIIRPDDWHLHVRDGKPLVHIVPHTARVFGRAIIMPNLSPPITTLQAAKEYRQRILDALTEHSLHHPQDDHKYDFEPLMTLYLHDGLSKQELKIAKASGIVQAVKLYPAGVTTHSEGGVGDFESIYPLLAEMEKIGLLLLVHGEEADPKVDIFDREKIFIERRLEPILTRFPGLKIVFEHISTADAVDFVKNASANVAATITVHHLLFNRNDLLQGGLQPHHYCAPIMKTEVDRQALILAATTGHSKFFLGTDSAPHPVLHKESCCCPAGIYTAPCALELYAEVFDSVGKIEQLEAFASLHGPTFYGFRPNKDKIKLKKEPTAIPEAYFLDENHDNKWIPLRAGGKTKWRVVHS